MLRFNCRLGLSVALSISLAACGSSSESATATPRATMEITATPVVTATRSASATPAPIQQSAVEIVAANAATGDGGNVWGGHQTRIVHGQAGIFTAYTVPGRDELHRQWRLAKRRSANDWVLVAQGDSGREPVNLLIAPDGTLHVVGWPDGIATLWSGKPEGESLVMTSQAIPGMNEGNWPYNSAGIGTDGTLCALASNGGQEPGGDFYWSCYLAASRRWVSHVSALDFRHCYTYVFPGSDGSLRLVSTRDVLWQALGYEQPAGSFDYVFNAMGFWRTANILDEPLHLVSYAEEPPTSSYSAPLLNAQMDAYLDTRGNMHILYWIEGDSTEGVRRSMHRIIAPSGEILFDAPLPPESGYYNRIFQDVTGRFYLLGSTGWMYPLDDNGERPGDPVRIDLGGHEVEYSGYGLSVPRTGTPLSNTIDVVFPSGNETQWLYLQIQVQPPG